MLIPNGKSFFVLEEKKSRFLAEIISVNSPEEARDLLKKKKSEYSDASHVVHAFITGEERQFMGMSDDGEPPGTAGKPVLEILKNTEITNLLLTVVRYFGGKKLGTGGLVRAYSNAALGAINSLAVKELVKYTNFKLNCSYHFYESLKKIILNYQGKIVDELFETDILIHGVIPEKLLNPFKNDITESSNGRSLVTICDYKPQA